MATLHGHGVPTMLSQRSCKFYALKVHGRQPCDSVHASMVQHDRMATVRNTQQKQDQMWSGPAKITGHVHMRAPVAQSRYNDNGSVHRHLALPFWGRRRRLGSRRNCRSQDGGSSIVVAAVSVSYTAPYLPAPGACLPASQTPPFVCSRPFASSLFASCISRLGSTLPPCSLPKLHHQRPRPALPQFSPVPSPVPPHTFTP